jgi:hypothetical protein
LKKRPKTFDECLAKGRKKFQKFFFNDIKQLMFTYPLDKKTKDGKLFWSQPKRPPCEVQFDPVNELHQKLVVSYACLLARVFKIEIPQEKKARTKEMESEWGQQVGKIECKEFQPSQEKANEINEEVDA